MPIRDPDAPDEARERPDPAFPAALLEEPEPADDFSDPKAATPPLPIVPARETPRELHLAVWRLAWPSVMTMMLQTVNSLLDVFFVGHLPNGAQALAATGAGAGVIFLLISLAMGVTVGTTALVARFTGANEPENAVHATGQSLTLAVGLALLFGALAYFSRDLLVAGMLDGRRSPEAAVLCSQFLGIALLGTLPMFLFNVIQSAFRGIGDTRTPLLVNSAAIAVHITLNWLLIYGRFGLPAMGVRGAATALMCSLYVSMTLFFVALAKRSALAAALQRSHLRLRSEWAWRILRIGIPAAVQAVIRTLSMMTFTGILARAAEGAAGVAALQIGIRSESIAFMPGFGYSIAASALVGQSLGARNPERAERCGWAATGQAITVMSLLAAFFFTFAGPISRLFTSDPLVQRLGMDFLRVSAIGEPFLGMGMVLTGALQGAGDTIRPTYITIITMWLVRVPLALSLMFGFHLNTHGAWIAMLVTTVLGGLMTVALFHSGRWKRIKV